MKLISYFSESSNHFGIECRMRQSSSYDIKAVIKKNSEMETKNITFFQAELRTNIKENNYINILNARAKRKDVTGTERNEKADNF